MLQSYMQFLNYTYLATGLPTIPVSRSIPVFTAGSTCAYSGISLPVNTRNTCSAMPCGNASISCCLFSRQASTMSLRTRCRCTELRNFFLGTEKPAFSLELGIRDWELGIGLVGLIFS